MSLLSCFSFRPEPANSLRIRAALVHRRRRRVGGSDNQIQHLHGKAAEYIWRCMGVPGFGWATIHYIRANNK